MWSKFVEAQGDKTQKTEQLFQVKATEQQTTKLDIGMGLPFNVNSHRRQLPWQSAKAMHFSPNTATLSPLMPLGT
ncbi:hypothetical protein GUITHDRAFT_122035 [Guillardia theta CCMP2712]|uniref:Uncharacterized protein n=1 Tax=Guillardia theta (strain CCMP2712) TaxID=905079 RepID=L1I7F2_GUITC|nr:hypothetical protein GUITHDRAFT_122035 [Guillardia theta CCMP2712]EKX31770.1 hypothetical protein GUITHDRAFT_122035 [Guillardia theta CCMP2712]|eukprot:XP_005818750.1 hypothetical protein GUITHDRAFT_122035 [Guillardia theta CCMP2712]